MGYGVNRLRGDYGMRYRRGDPGFLSGLLGGVASLIPGGSAVLGAGKALLSSLGGKPKSPTGPAVVGVPGIGGAIQRFLPGGQTGLMVAGTKHRRIDPGNTKALNRAIRRVNSFGSLVARSKKSVAKANRALNPAHHRTPARKR